MSKVKEVIRSDAKTSRVNAGDYVNVKALQAFAVEGLGQMIDPERRLFCHRVLLDNGVLKREGVSQRYTIMTLLGLYRSKPIAPIVSRTSEITEALFGDFSWITTAGDAGLMLWLSALAAPDRLDSLSTKLPIHLALQQLPDVQEGRTMELSWLLTGLCYACAASTKSKPEFERLAHGVYKLLEKNQGHHGFFGHQTGGTLLHRLRGRMGSFADQVYPIYATTLFGRTLGGQGALERATRCAEAICQVQGVLGQWWWHYDAEAGRVVQRYPVYSVHQDGMAPMALLAIGDATGRDYSDNIMHGLRWIYGQNELTSDLREPKMHVIWRNVHLPKWRAWAVMPGNLLRGITDARLPTDLRVLRECRPYHLGWLLYAFGERAGRENLELERETQ